MDAVPFILEITTTGNEESKQRFEYLREMRRFLQWRRGDAVLLGEANVLPGENKHYFGEEGDGIHLMFNFYVNQYMFYALASADTTKLVEALEATRNLFHTSQWANFLRNHDELDLGRLSEQERQKVFERFGPDPNMQIYDRGIRRRLSPMLGSRQHTELAYSLMFSLPGTPVIRYGDEIGMGDDLSLKERDSVRTPMHWSDEKQGGFSEGEKLIHPVIDEGPYSFSHVNVDGQRRNPGSLLNWMTTLIRLRKECPEIGWGDWKVVNTNVKHVLVMHYTWQGSSIVIIHNFDEKPHEIRINLKEDKNQKLVDLLNLFESVPDKKGNHKITLGAQCYRWFRAGNLEYLFHRPN